MLAINVACGDSGNAQNQDATVPGAAPSSSPGHDALNEVSNRFATEEATYGTTTPSELATAMADIAALPEEHLPLAQAGNVLGWQPLASKSPEFTLIGGDRVALNPGQIGYLLEYRSIDDVSIGFTQSPNLTQHVSEPPTRETESVGPYQAIIWTDGRQSFGEFDTGIVAKDGRVLAFVQSSTANEDAVRRFIRTLG